MNDVTPQSILAYARDLLAGRKRGRQGEQGWTDGEFAAYQKDSIRTCMNGALRVAERDVYQMNLWPEARQVYGRGPAGQFYSARMEQDGTKSAQRLLAEACVQLQPNILKHETLRDWSLSDGPVYDGWADDPSLCSEVIILFNDAGYPGAEETTQDDIDQALELAEKMAFEQWVRQHYDQQTDDEVIDDLLAPLTK